MIRAGWKLLVAYLLVRATFAVGGSWFDSWEGSAVDALFQLREQCTSASPPMHEDIVGVLIDDETEDALGRDIDRQSLAELMTFLARDAGARVQLIDYVFEPRAQNAKTRALRRAAEQANNAYIGQVAAPGRGPWEPRTATDMQREESLRASRWNPRTVRGTTEGMLARGRVLTPDPELVSTVAGIGFVDVEPDSDGTIRRVSLLIRDGEGFQPSLALCTLAGFLRVRSEDVIVRAGESITLPGAKLPDGTRRDIVVPIDREGRVLVNWAQDNARLRYHRFEDVFLARPSDRPLWRKRFGGRVVVVADASFAAQDIGPIPVDRNYRLAGVHANVMNTVLQERYIEEAGTGVRTLIELALAAALMIAGRCRRAWALATGIVGAAVTYAAVVFAVFVGAGVILGVVRPFAFLALAGGVLLVARYIREERRRAIVRGVFEAFFPPPVVAKLVRQPDRVRVGGERKELTVLFSDIRSFAARSSAMEPDDVQRMLNHYFERMNEIVFEHGGTLDKFIGDGLMVFFGDPETQPDHALRCVRAAREMQRSARAMSPEWEEQGWGALEIRIGIHTGEVVVGNMGSSRRLSYTVLGSAVNLAARLESSAPVGGILISAATRAAIGDAVATAPCAPVTVKGFSEPIEVYTVDVEGP